MIEVKTELGSVEGTLRPLDVKVRLAANVALDRFGWSAQSVGRALVMPETRTSRKAVLDHSDVLRAQLPETSRRLHSWLRNPRGDIGAIWFVSAPGGADWPTNPSAAAEPSVTEQEPPVIGAENGPAT